MAWKIPDKMTIATDFEASLWSGVANIFENDAVTLENSYPRSLGCGVSARCVLAAVSQ